MDTIFMKSKNSKTSDPHRLLLNLANKIDLKISDKYVALSNLSIEYTWNDPSTRIYINKIENIITIKSKTRYYLELLIPEIMKLLGSTKGKITKNENGENVLHLEITEIVLVNCKIINIIKESCIHLFLINSLLNH